MKKDSRLLLNEYFIDACSMENPNWIRYFYEQGANVNGRNLQGFTPLMAAALAGKEDVVRFLLKNGADVFRKHPVGFTAMSCALASKNAAVISLLKEKGARFP